MKPYQWFACAVLCLTVLLNARPSAADDRAEDVKFIVQDLDANAGKFSKHLEAFKQEEEFNALQKDTFNVRLYCTSIYNRGGDPQYIKPDVERLDKAIERMKPALNALQQRVGEQATMQAVLSFSAMARQVGELKDLVK